MVEGKGEAEAHGSQRSRLTSRKSSGRLVPTNFEPKVNYCSLTSAISLDHPHVTVYNRAKGSTASKQLGKAEKGRIDKSKVAPQLSKAEVEAQRDAEDAAREAKLQARYEAQMAEYLADDDAE